MPWTAADMKKKGAQNPAEAARIANTVLRRCQDEGGKDCEGMAIRVALAQSNKDTRR